MRQPQAANRLVGGGAHTRLSRVALRPQSDALLIGFLGRRLQLALAFTREDLAAALSGLAVLRRSNVRCRIDKAHPAPQWRLPRQQEGAPQRTGGRPVTDQAGGSVG